jgi:hypothetical protein
MVLLKIRPRFCFRGAQGKQGVTPETVEELRSAYPVADHPMACARARPFLEK